MWMWASTWSRKPKLSGRKSKKSRAAKYFSFFLPVLRRFVGFHFNAREMSVSKASFYINRRQLSARRHAKSHAAPFDLVSDQADRPDAERDQVANRREPEVPRQRAVFQTVYADDEKRQEPGEDRQGQQPQCEARKAPGQVRHQRRRHAVSQDHSSITPRARDSHRPRPSQLMSQHRREGGGRGDVFDHAIRKDDLQSFFRGLIAEQEVVYQIVRQRGEPYTEFE